MRNLELPLKLSYVCMCYCSNNCMCELISEGAKLAVFVAILSVN